MMLYLRLILLNLLLMFTAIIANGQLTKEDSLSVLKSLRSVEYMQKRNQDSAIVLCYQTIQLAQNSKLKSAVWKAKICLGRSYFDIGQKDSAYQVINSVLSEIKQKSNRVFEMEARLALAWFYQSDFRFEPAITELLEADKLWVDTDSIYYKFQILKQLGTTHKKMKNYPVALKYFEQIKDEYFPILTEHQRYQVLMNEGNVYATKGDYVHAENLYIAAFEKLAGSDSPSDVAMLTYNLGGVYLKQRKYNDANELIHRSLKANLEIGNQSQIENCYRVLGAIKQAQGKYIEAEKYYLKALEVAKKINKRKAILSNYENLYRTDWNQGYYTQDIEYMDKALMYFQKYDTLKDSIYQLETANKILELEKQYETEKKNNQIALLEQENRNNETEIRAQHSQRKYLIFIIILIGAISCVFIYFYYNLRKLNRLLRAQQRRIVNQRNIISKQNQALKRSIDTQNKLHSIIAHDLRSPLASISNIIQLTEFYLKEKKYKEMADVLRMLDQKNNQILDLTDNLLNWARSQTGGVKPFFEIVRFNETLDICMELYGGVAESKNIDLHYEQDEAIVFWADKNMVRTLCRNLINNAIKFTPKGGTINIKSVLKEKVAQICVQDSGVGISEEKLKVLFDVDPTKVSAGTEGEKSSGLGLLVCKEFVEKMSGTITVKSEIGKGSCFIIELPLYQF